MPKLTVTVLVEMGGQEFEWACSTLIPEGVFPEEARVAVDLYENEGTPEAMFLDMETAILKKRS